MRPSSAVWSVLVFLRNLKENSIMSSVLLSLNLWNADSKPSLWSVKLPIQFTMHASLSVKSTLQLVNRWSTSHHSWFVFHQSNTFNSQQHPPSRLVPLVVKRKREQLLKNELLWSFEIYEWSWLLSSDSSVRLIVFKQSLTSLRNLQFFIIKCVLIYPKVN